MPGAGVETWTGDRGSDPALGREYNIQKGESTTTAKVLDGSGAMLVVSAESLGVTA